MTAGPVPAMPDNPTPLDAALAYAARGWRVVPIAPGTKYPKGMDAWQRHASTDPETIRSWWTGLYKDHGVGIATGPESGIWVLDIDDHDALHDVEATHGPLPDTLTSVTGSGGAHLFFAWDDAHEVRNNQSGKIAAGIDVRGDGGFVVAPPTVHPNGTRYEWEASTEGAEPAEAPAWLYELLEPEVVEQAPSRPAPLAGSHDERPGDIWARSTSWADILTTDGWTLAYTDRQGESHWVRPGKTAREGTSATTGYTDADTLKVFTSSMRHVGLEPDETYTKLGYLAATRHGGDHRAAAQWLAAQGHRAPEVDLGELLVARTVEDQPVAALPPIVEELATTWELVDLDGILDGTYEPPTPTIGKLSNTKALIYRGRVHSIAGEPGGGKTWLALHIIAEQITAGGSGALIDYEDTAQAAVHRLRLLGMADEQIRSSFRYLRPDGPLVGKGGRINAAAMEVLEQLDVDVVVIDSVGESLAVEGLPPNDDDAVTQWFRRLPRMLARRGAAVIGLDHVTKSKDDRGLWAIGSQRKLAAIDGAAYGVDVKTAPTKTKDGELKVTCAKDRHGTYQRGHLVAKALITNVDSGVRVTLQAPDERFRPTNYMERVSRFLEEIPCASQRGIISGVMGKAAHLKVAIECLVDEGYVKCEATGRGNQYSSITTFRDDELGEQLVDNSPETDRDPPRPHRDPPVGDAVQEGPPNDRDPRFPDPTVGGSVGDAVGGPGDSRSHEGSPRPRPPEVDELEGLF